MHAQSIDQRRLTWYQKASEENGKEDSMRPLGVALVITGLIIGMTSLIAPPVGATSGDLWIIYGIAIGLMIVELILLIKRPEHPDKGSS